MCSLAVHAGAGSRVSPLVHPATAYRYFIRILKIRKGERRIPNSFYYSSCCWRCVGALVMPIMLASKKSRADGEFHFLSPCFLTVRVLLTACTFDFQTHRLRISERKEIYLSGYPSSSVHHAHLLPAAEPSLLWAAIKITNGFAWICPVASIRSPGACNASI
jgi:hypothetical protein